MDLEIVTAAAAYNTGPRYSEETIDSMANVLRSTDNMYYYNTQTANDTDGEAARLVQQSAFTGQKVVLTSQQAAHIRKGAEFAASRKDELPSGFVNSLSDMYANIYDEDGRKVVDRRKFKLGNQ